MDDRPALEGRSAATTHTATACWRGTLPLAGMLPGYLAESTGAVGKKLCRIAWAGSIFVPFGAFGVEVFDPVLAPRLPARSGEQAEVEISEK